MLPRRRGLSRGQALIVYPGTGAYSGERTSSDSEEFQLTTNDPLHTASEHNAVPVEDVDAQTAHQAQPDDSRPERATRRRLTPEQQREVARLYADSTTPTSEIRKQFGIGESSLYRIVQRQGVPLRGRSGSPHEPAPARVQPSETGRRRASTASVRASRRTPAVDGRVSAPGTSGRGQFRVAFQAERVIKARDIWEALYQVESLAGIEVTAITRED